MAWSESGYQNEEQLHNDVSGAKLDNSDIHVDNNVDETTKFLSKFEGKSSDIIRACIQDINSDYQLKNGLEDILKSVNVDDFIAKIKHELNDGIKGGLDEETLKLYIQGIIADNIGEYKIGLSAIEGSVTKKVQDTQTAETDKEKAKTDKEKAETDKEKAKTQIDNLDSEKAMRQAIETRDKLVDKYANQNLDAKTNQNSENYQIVKTKLESNGTLKQLRQTHDEQFINDYILVQTTLTELKSNPTIYDQNDISYFDKIVKGLNNACNIPDTNLNSFSSGNITQTRHELFNSDIGNQDLIEAKKGNLESRDYSEMINEEMSAEDLIQTYGKFLPNGAKPYLDKYNQHVFNNTIKEYRETDEYKQFIKLVENVKTAFDNETKKMVEELCIISQIKGMYMCMGEGADFQMNKTNEIESKDGILTLNGHIDGIDFSIRQDTNDPEARLQTSTRFRKKDNAFEIGNHFEDSNFILPSQSEVFNLAVKSVNSDGALQEADTPADYVSKLQDKIMSKMDDMYEDTKYVNHYMHEQVKGEKVVDKSLALVKNIKKSEIPTPITESNKGLFDFVGLIHFNIENSTSLEKTKLDSCLTKIQTIVDEYKNKNKNNNTDNNADKDADKDADIDEDTNKAPEPGKYPPIIEHYLTDKTILKNTENLLTGKAVEGESLFDLFNHYKDTSDQRSDGKFGMINYTSLENDLIPGNQSHSLIAKEFVASQDKNGADDYLANSLESIDSGFAMPMSANLAYA